MPPCDVKPFPESEKLQGADVLIAGNTRLVRQSAGQGTAKFFTLLLLLYLT